MKHYFIIIYILFSIPTCIFSQQIDKEIFIPIEKSKLYVRLIGNESCPIIINLHGGPGAFSGFDHEYNRHYLEDGYLIAYLDQRGSGKSESFADTSYFTMEQFVEDLDKVVDYLKIQYPESQINLLGSSWGGTLGLLYLIQHQEKINTFACVSGKANGIYPIYALIDYENQIIQNKKNDNLDSVQSNKYQAMLQKLAEVKKSDLDQFYNDLNLIKTEYPRELGFSAYWANKAAQLKAAELAKDPAYFKRAHYTKEEFNTAMKKFDNVNRVFRNTSEYNHLNILDKLSIIQTPILVMQGDKDYAIGPNQGKMIYNALTNKNKSLKIIPNAAHNLNIEAEKEYYTTLLLFFNKYNLQNL